MFRSFLLSGWGKVVVSRFSGQNICNGHMNSYSRRCYVSSKKKIYRRKLGSSKHKIHAKPVENVTDAKKSTKLSDKPKTVKEMQKEVKESTMKILSDTDPSELKKKTSAFKPISVKPLDKSEEGNVGEEIAGPIDKEKMTEVLRKFALDDTVRDLAAQNGVDESVFEDAMYSFITFCVKSSYLPVDLHVSVCDIINDAGHHSNLLPYFLEHARRIYPHLECLEDLKTVSDLTKPAKWYPVARQMKRKIIFHGGPTNSGKTYHALQRFMQSEKGVYCAPLRLLAMEIFSKCKDKGVPCDLVTGEMRTYADNEENPAHHLSCTVEMTRLEETLDVAVIDEIQMIGDESRGHAWTRALLGIPAREVHVCGEETAIELVRSLAKECGDEFEVRTYDRLTKLTYKDEELGGFSAVQPGDCIVCFSKRHIFQVRAKLNALGHNVAVIYGSLPPDTKIMQAEAFNDPNNNCNILVATDAVGMGLNLSIRRMVFYEVKKPVNNSHEKEYLTTSQATQIAGRAGRFATKYKDGLVTTFYKKDLKMLHEIVSREKEPLTKAGVQFTPDIVDTISYYLPAFTFYDLLVVFKHLSQVTENYFVCELESMKKLAAILRPMPLPIKVQRVLCLVPIKTNKERDISLVVFKKIGKQMSQGIPLTFSWLYNILGAPFHLPTSISELEHMEALFNVVDMYLWLSFRFPEMFLDIEQVQSLRKDIAMVIKEYLSLVREQKIHRYKDKTAEGELLDTSSDDDEVIAARDQGVHSYDDGVVVLTGGDQSAHDETEVKDEAPVQAVNEKHITFWEDSETKVKFEDLMSALYDQGTKKPGLSQSVRDLGSQSGTGSPSSDRRAQTLGDIVTGVVQSDKDMSYLNTEHVASLQLPSEQSSSVSLSIDDITNFYAALLAKRRSKKKKKSSRAEIASVYEVSSIYISTQAVNPYIDYDMEQFAMLYTGIGIDEAQDLQQATAHLDTQDYEVSGTLEPENSDFIAKFRAAVDDAQSQKKTVYAVPANIHKRYKWIVDQKKQYAARNQQHLNVKSTGDSNTVKKSRSKDNKVDFT